MIQPQGELSGGHCKGGGHRAAWRWVDAKACTNSLKPVYLMWHIVCYRLFDGQLADLVVSDGAPDVTGLHDMDEFLQVPLFSG